MNQHLDKGLLERNSSKYETENIERQLSSVEGDIQMFNRRLTHQDNEYLKWKQFTSHIQRLLLQAKNEIHNEILARTSCEKTATQLRIEMSKLREQQRKSVVDLKKSSYVLSLNSSNDRALTFKSELSNAIKNIRQDFDKQNDLLRNEFFEKFKKSYEDVVRQNPDLALFLNERDQQRIREEEQRVRTEIQRTQSDAESLKDKNADLKLRVRELQIKIEMCHEENKRIEKAQDDILNQWRTKHEQMTKDYDDGILKQTSLENEIDTYRNLLEGAMKSVGENIPNEHSLTHGNNEKQQQQINFSSPKRIPISIQPLLSSTSPRGNIYDHNSYVSSMTVNLNNNLASSLPIESTLTKRNNFFTNKSLGSFYLKKIDSSERTPEKKETTNEGPSTAVRTPIIIETRRKK